MSGQIITFKTNYFISAKLCMFTMGARAFVRVIPSWHVAKRMKAQKQGCYCSERHKRLTRCVFNLYLQG